MTLVVFLLWSIVKVAKGDHLVFQVLWAGEDTHTHIHTRAWIGEARDDALPFLDQVVPHLEACRKTGPVWSEMDMGMSLF